MNKGKCKDLKELCYDRDSWRAATKKSTDVCISEKKTQIKNK